MKKLLSFILAVCLIVPFFARNSQAIYRPNSSSNPAPVEIKDDSVLILKADDTTIDDIELTIPTSLEYQEIVFPYGTDLSKVKFTFDLDKLQFAMSENLMSLHNISEGALEGYFIRLREDRLKGGIDYAKNDGEYEQFPQDGLVLEDGADYTISLDGTYEVYAHNSDTNQAISDTSMKRWMKINQESRKFAFSVSIADPIADPNILEGATHEMVGGTDKPLTIKVDYDFDKFKEVECDGNRLTKDKDYTVVRGSTVVTLSEEFMKSLAVGEHKIKILFTDVSATAIVKVTAKQDATQNNATGTTTSETPKTGDNSTIGLMMVLMVGAVATIAVVSKKRKYN